MKCSVPCLSESKRISVKLAAVATANPLIPANQVVMEIAKTATANVLNEFTKPIEVKARESS